VSQATEIRLALEVAQYGRALCPWCIARAIRGTLENRVRRMRRTGSPRGVPRIDGERANARAKEDGDMGLLEAHAHRRRTGQCAAGGANLD